MKYKIYCNGELIAGFASQVDRDICLEALEESFEDANFTTDI